MFEIINVYLDRRRGVAINKMADPVEHVVENILRNITRFINGLTDENRNTRKRSLEGIRKEILSRKPQLEPEDLQHVLKEIVKPLLQVLSDPVEKCRDLSVCFMTDCLKTIPEPYEFLSFIIPAVVQRIGQQDIVESSEELRLSLVKLLLILVESCKKKMGPYVDDMVKILQRTIIDPFPEVKKESCHCASALAKAVPEFFHMQSETLIKPLLISISHQHSRVRVDVIKAIGRYIGDNMQLHTCTIWNLHHISTFNNNRFTRVSNCPIGRSTWCDAILQSKIFLH